MTPTPHGRPRFFWAVFLITTLYAAFLAFGQVRAGGVFGAAGNDDIMRLMSVRDWLAGQSWYDMTQYALLPPEGVSIHWSRYVDLGIGALVWAFALIVPMATAELTAAVVWPFFLLIALMLVVGLNTRAILGSVAGAIAVAAVVLFPPIGFNYFATGKLDHHNVQILLMTAALFAMIRTERPVLGGIIAGIASALSLAIGLETLFFVAAIGLIHVVQAARDKPGNRKRLAAFCIAIVAASVMFFVGQTAPSLWTETQCDRLSPPYLLVATIGAISGLAALAVPGVRGHIVLFMGIVAAATVLGLALALPIISPCLQPPYANLPVAAQVFIQDRIQEALPLMAYAKSAPFSFVQHFGPAIMALVLATWAYLRTRSAAPSAVGQMLLFGWIGMLACVAQNRQVVLLATVTPFLIGYVAAPYLNRYLADRTAAARNGALTVLAVTLFLPLLASGVVNAWPKPQTLGATTASAFASVAEDQACQENATLVLLNDLAPAKILTGLNLGPRLIMATHHFGMAAPYHRSADAIMNGFAPLGGDAAGLRAAMQEQGITYVALCKGSGYGGDGSIGAILANAATPVGFTQVAIDHPYLRVFSLADTQ